MYSERRWLKRWPHFLERACWAVSTTIIIILILLIVLPVLMVLRFNCQITKKGHVWQTYPGDDMFAPNLPDRCRRCGKEKPRQY